MGSVPIRRKGAEPQEDPEKVLEKEPGIVEHCAILEDLRFIEPPTA